MSTAAALTRPASALRVVPDGAPGGPGSTVRDRSPRWSSPAPWLAVICLVQVLLANRPGLNRNAFEDEGLYVYIGHRMIDHLLHGAFLSEYPGKYFSGARGSIPCSRQWETP